MTETAEDIIRAGASCLAGKCIPKADQHRSNEAMIAAIEEKIQALIEQQRPQREREIRTFAAKHGFSAPTIAALIGFILDHER